MAPLSVWWIRTSRRRASSSTARKAAIASARQLAAAQVVDEIERRPGVEDLEQALELAAHREGLRREQERIGMLAIVAVEDAAEGGEQVEQRDLVEIDLLALLPHPRRACRRAQSPCRMRSTSASACAASLIRRYSSSRCTSSSRGSSSTGSPSDLPGPRQEHPRLELDQQRRLVDVLAGDVQVHLLHQAEVFVELVADGRHRNVGDLDLVELDQVQQQVERTVEDRQVDAPGRPAAGGGPPALALTAAPAAGAGRSRGRGRRGPAPWSRGRARAPAPSRRAAATAAPRARAAAPRGAAESARARR